MVPWSEATHSRLESELKLTQWMVAGWEPRRSSVRIAPLPVSNTRTSVPWEDSEQYCELSPKF